MDNKASGLFRYGGLWLLAALVMGMSVYVLNGGLLFYFDSASYLSQGLTALEGMNLLPAAPAETQGAAAATAAEGPDTGQTVNGSRSLFYGLVVAALTGFGRLDLILVLDLAVVFLSVWLLVRVAQRTDQVALSPLATTGVALFFACLGALPFYLAYVMPDILAPVLILIVALLAGYANRMRWWEIVLALVLGFGAVLTHPSHLAMALLSLPLIALIAGLVQRPGFWIAPLLVGMMIGVGVGERMLFRLQVTERTGSEVRYNPYLTARLIQDGPGYAYLEDKCPNPDIATCALYDALQLSDNPRRLTATHIIFENTTELGSLRHMDELKQKAVGDAQYRFFIDVLLDRPVHTVGALLKNTFSQAALFSIQQTIPNDNARRIVLSSPDIPDGTFIDGRLTRDQAWTTPLHIFQSVLYGVSLILILVLLVKPSALSGRMKAVTVMMLLGILINAFVCGALSQPAARYGARVIWLLPLMAVILWGFANAAQTEERLGGGHYE